MSRRLWWITSLSIAWLGMAGAASADHTQACALQHRYGAAHQYWVLPPGDHYVIEERIIVRGDSPDDTFYTLQFGFENGGGYIGLQPGDSQRHVRFSIWNAQSAAAGFGASCERFSGEGVGDTCVLPKDILIGETYTVRVRPIDLRADGPWWQGSVVDENGTEHVIGWIQGPAGMGLIRSALSWVEYFGPDADATCECRTLPPVAEAVFSRPLIDNTSYAGYGHADRGHCSGGEVTRVPSYLCSIIQLGTDTTNWSGPSGVPVYGDSQCERCWSDAQCAPENGQARRCDCQHICVPRD